MSAENHEIELSATLPAAELARLQRRVMYLEAAVIQMLRDERELREWFSAREIASLELPGLPVTKGGVARVAREQGWSYRTVSGARDDRRLYHFADLPRLAFAGFIERVIRAGPGPDASRYGDASEAPTPAVNGPLPALAGPVGASASPPSNATPTWVLPLLRLLKAGGGPLEHALGELPRHLAPGAPVPSPDEAREVLAQVGVSSL